MVEKLKGEGLRERETERQRERKRDREAERERERESYRNYLQICIMYICGEICQQCFCLQIFPFQLFAYSIQRTRATHFVCGESLFC